MRAAAGRDADDDFNFEILKLEEKRKPDGSGYRGATYKATVIARIGLREFKKFSLDITEHRHTQNPLEEVEVRPLLDELLPDSVAEFRILATSIEGQIADKICAMREMHANGLNTRYHDLADLVGIINTQAFSAREVRERVENEAYRRQIAIPTGISAPEGWKQGYEKNAPSFNIAKEFHDLEHTVNFVAGCFNPVLAGGLQDETWDPVKQAWI